MINLFALVCDPFSTFIHARGFVPSSVTGRKHDDENSPHFRTRMRLHVSVLSSNKGYITKNKNKRVPRYNTKKEEVICDRCFHKFHKHTGPHTQNPSPSISSRRCCRVVLVGGEYRGRAPMASAWPARGATISLCTGHV